VIATPSISIVPLVGASKPASMLSTVVLPQPLGPRRQKNSPSATSSVKFSTAMKRGFPVGKYDFSTSRNATSGAELIGAIIGARNGLVQGWLCAL
jgi:hypothetical protein